MVKKTEKPRPRHKPHITLNWSVYRNGVVCYFWQTVHSSGTGFTAWPSKATGFLLPTKQILNTHLSAVYNTWHHDTVTKEKKNLNKKQTKKLVKDTQAYLKYHIQNHIITQK